VRRRHWAFPLRPRWSGPASEPGMKNFMGNIEDVGRAGTAYVPYITSQGLHRAYMKKRRMGAKNGAPPAENVQEGVLPEEGLGARRRRGI